MITLASAEFRDRFDMGRPAELIDQQQLRHLKAAFGQNSRILGEIDGIAGDEGDGINGGSGDLGRLPGGAGTRRINHGDETQEAELLPSWNVTATLSSD